MVPSDAWVVVGLDNGGTKNNATVLDAAGRFLVAELIETPSRVKEGPEVALAALVLAFEDVLARSATARERVRSVGLVTPGPASASGVISSRGSTNFAHPGWRNFDFRAPGPGPGRGGGGQEPGHHRAGAHERGPHVRPRPGQQDRRSGHLRHGIRPLRRSAAPPGRENRQRSPGGQGEE